MYKYLTANLTPSSSSSSDSNVCSYDWLTLHSPPSSPSPLPQPSPQYYLFQASRKLSVCFQGAIASNPKSHADAPPPLQCPLPPLLPSQSSQFRRRRRRWKIRKRYFFRNFWLEATWKGGIWVFIIACGIRMSVELCLSCLLKGSVEMWGSICKVFENCVCLEINRDWNVYFCFYWKAINLNYCTTWLFFFFLWIYNCCLDILLPNSLKLNHIWNRGSGS